MQEREAPNFPRKGVNDLKLHYGAFVNLQKGIVAAEPSRGSVVLDGSCGAGLTGFQPRPLGAEFLNVSALGMNEKKETMILKWILNQLTDKTPSPGNDTILR